MTFAQPAWLLLLVLVPLLLWLQRRPKHQGIPLSTFRLLEGDARRAPRWVGLTLRGLQVGVVVAMVVAMARPQGAGTWIEQKRFGIDIMLALDISGSMRAEDFQPANRLEAAKRVLKEFIAKNAENRLGLVVFAGRSLTMCPLTTDTQVVAQVVDRVNFDSVGIDGTAIGDGIGNSLYRLEDRSAKSRVIVLLSDGANNSGYLQPMAAASMARARKVKVYTIAVGSPGGAPIPLVDSFGRKVYVHNRDGSLYLPKMDEQTLMAIAQETGGRFFRATDTRTLSEAYAEIAKLERSEIPVERHRVPTELFGSCVAVALLLLGLQIALAAGAGSILRGSVRRD
ncbi:MAG TPA: VWA domain-containing protein [Stenomitos sp.]